MLKKIKIVPLAAESFGVRSMCSYIETSDVKILLDAGVSLAPNRFGLPPHPKEYDALAQCRKKIADAADKAEVVTISHYHFDHHTPSFTDWCYSWSSKEVARQVYEGKTVLAKSYRSKINFSQRRRGWMFSKTGGSFAKELIYADSKVFEFGETKLRFSKPVFHGPKNSKLGWLLMVTVEHESERLLYTSDVQGPMCEATLKSILAQNPQIIIIGGPPTYLGGLVNQEDVQQGIRNLEKLAEKVPSTILEHHLLRDENWRRLSQPIFDFALKAGHRVVTAAKFLRGQDNLLEYQRKKLFEVEPPSSEFSKWMKLPRLKRKRIKPPI
jgi:predicted metallo-beta-lactamase superfamily hydrolase